jgi:hypothetical protein
MASLSAYEEQRARNIARNAAVLSSLGLDEPLLGAKPKATPRAKKRKSEPTRELSRRVRMLPTPAYTPGLDEVMADTARKADVDEGRRLPDGTWTGERFGEVDSVPVGTVFGKGDYQRLGRQEMMDNGFFRPFVTPEWVAPGEGCYSIILNNDNGASTDEGERILYAGSGGRRRGQNRTAAQSFDQDWSNLTNAALRQNCETGKPVRVVRGPKLQGEHGTGACGGGYRYDGLYTVETAELVRRPGAAFRTAMFTLVRK